MPMAPILWQANPACVDSRQARDVLARAAAAGADWIYIPSFLSAAEASELARLLGLIGSAWSVVIGLRVDQLQGRAVVPLQQRLAELGLRRCHALMIQGMSPTDAKSGRPFHRVIQLRERGLIDASFVYADDFACAQWMVENSPAHAVCLPYGLADQTAAYGLLRTAAENGAALIAAPVILPPWQPAPAFTAEMDLSFIAAEPGIAAVLRPLPLDPERLERMIHAVSTPMLDSDRQTWQDQYRQFTPPPSRPIRGLPSEFGE